jgi:hypothetical protein
MAQLTAEVTKRLEHVPQELHAEFPHVPLTTIEHDLNDRARDLSASARFNDYIPVLAHRAVRDRLRASA